MNDAEWEAYEVRQKRIDALRRELEDARHRAMLSARSYVAALDKPDGPYRDSDAAVILGLLREDLAAEEVANTAWRDAAINRQRDDAPAGENDADWLENRQIDGSAV